MFRKALLALLCLVPTAAHAQWYEASTKHFLVYSDEDPAKVEEFATHLERFDKMLRFLRNIADDPVGPAGRVSVFLIDDPDEVGRLAHSSSAAGFYVPRAGEPAAYVPARDDPREDNLPEEYQDMRLTPQQVLLHEYTHHFLLSLNPKTVYPSWFTEGYAEFFAPSEFQPDGSIIIGRPPLYRTFGMFGENPYPADKMLTVDPTKKLTGEQYYMLYVRGWLLTHYLFLGGKREGQLGAYFRALNDGKSPTEAAQVFGDLKQLESELWAYKRTDFGAMKVAAAVLPIDKVTVRKLDPAEVAMMPVRLQLRAYVHDDEAAALFAAARTAAAPWPNDPRVQAELGEAAFLAKDYAAAEAADDRALAAEPKNIDALLGKAQAKMEAAKKAGDKTPATWGAIRKLIAAANRADTEDPIPLWLFYKSYTEAGEAPPKMARDGLYYAFMLAPQDSFLRFDAATSYLAEGNVPDARALLATSAVDPHNRSRAELAVTMIAAIDAGHPDQALDALAKKTTEWESQKDGKDGKKPKK